MPLAGIHLVRNQADIGSWDGAGFNGRVARMGVQVHERLRMWYRIWWMAEKPPEVDDASGVLFGASYLAA